MAGELVHVKDTSRLRKSEVISVTLGCIFKLLFFITIQNFGGSRSNRATVEEIGPLLQRFNNGIDSTHSKITVEKLGGRVMFNFTQFTGTSHRCDRRRLSSSVQFPTITIWVTGWVARGRGCTMTNRRPSALTS